MRGREKVTKSNHTRDQTRVKKKLESWMSLFSLIRIGILTLITLQKQRRRMLPNKMNATLSMIWYVYYCIIVLATLSDLYYSNLRAELTVVA